MAPEWRLAKALSGGCQGLICVGAAGFSGHSSAGSILAPKSGWGMLGTVKECERNIKKPQSQNAEICQVHPSILRDYQLVDRPLGLNSSYRVRGSPFPLPQCFQLLSTCETPTGETGSTGHTRANLWPRCAREIHCKPMQTMRFFPVLLTSIVLLSIS